MVNDKKKGSFFKKPLIVLTMILAVSVSGFLFYESGFSLEVNFNGEVVGYAKDSEIVDSALALVESDVSETFGKEAYFEKEVLTEKVRGHKKDVVDSQILSGAMAHTIDIYKPATVIKIDDKETVVVESESVANEILTVLKKPFEESKEGGKVLDVFFVQEVEVISKDVLVDEILSFDSALLPFRIKAAKPQEINNEETIEVSNLLAENTEELVNLTVDKDKSKVKPTSRMAFDVEGLSLDVVSIEEEVEVETVDFETVEEEDSTIYKGEKEVKQEGVEGEKEITFKATYINGKQDSKEEVSEKITVEPEDKIISVGTKVRPVATPTYSSPAYSSPAYNGSVAGTVVSEAWVQVNNQVPYVFGGSSTAGFDCSGLTSYVFRRAGINLPHGATAQTGYGSAVSRGDLRAGDLVFFGSGGSINHVGIYIGNGQMIHAPVPGSNVSVASINNSYFAPRYVTARRIG